jgi:3,4-dihydroxy 2-butanone 4-phosphate synthase / GTP cyclohydrolase II
MPTAIFPEEITEAVATAIDDFRRGHFLIVVDDEDRENEGDLVIAAEFATPDAINFMAREGRGLICAAMSGERVDRLGLPLMVPAEANKSGFGTAFTVSVEARHGVTTGISAHDRARTIAVLINPQSTPADLVQPGHVFPLRARDGGVLERRGQTEAGVDLARLAGLTPAAVICEIMAPDGSMARLPLLREFGARHGIRLISVAALADYRRQIQGAGPATGARAGNHAPSELHSTVQRVATADLPTVYGRFQVTAYRDCRLQEHLLISRGDLSAAKAPLVRLHSECLTGDVLGSLRCDCGQQLQLALQRIAAEGRGALLYLRQEGRGIGLANKIRAYALQDQGLDTVEANTHLNFPPDARTYAAAAAILLDAGVTAVRLMTNNPQKVESLVACGIQVVAREPHLAVTQKENRHYLRTKALKLGHILPELT